jgi:tRNA-dihydrouridine synthase B
MNYWNEKLKIGSLVFPRFVSGPLDGVTDSPFRRLVREFSPDVLVYSEMRHVSCVANEKGGTKALAFHESERPLNFQLTANSTEKIEQACQKVLERGVDLVDLNIGCPARNVVGSGSGSAMMADLNKLGQVLRLMRANLPGIPFTVKMRAGFKEKNAYEAAALAQDCGVDAIAIHPRSQTQKFSGDLDYELAARIKKSLSIPLLFSGGVIDFTTAEQVYERTGVDGYLIGRGLWSKPWKLAEMYEHSQGRPFTVDRAVVVACALKHLDYSLEYYGSRGLYCFRKHLPHYVTGVQGASALRTTLVTAGTVQQVRNELIRCLG